MQAAEERVGEEETTILVLPYTVKLFYIHSLQGEVFSSSISTGISSIGLDARRLDRKSKNVITLQPRGADPRNSHRNSVIN